MMAHSRLWGLAALAALVVNACGGDDIPAGNPQATGGAENSPGAGGSSSTGGAAAVVTGGQAAATGGKLSTGGVGPAVMHHCCQEIPGSTCVCTDTIASCAEALASYQTLEPRWQAVSGCPQIGTGGSAPATGGRPAATGGSAPSGTGGLSAFEAWCQKSSADSVWIYTDASQCNAKTPPATVVWTNKVCECRCDAVGTSYQVACYRA